jgi:hypothetical protein
MRPVLLFGLAVVLIAADDKKPVVTAEVKVKAVVPARLESFKDRTLEVLLYKYDPRLADTTADLVDRYEVKNFAHTRGTDTVKVFSLGKKEKLDEKKGYYLTLFILDGKTRTHIGECEHARGFARVLTGTAPNEVSATFREVKR